jgi:aspartate racemase
MKKVGIIGGIGPESTIQYYKFIIQQFRERLGTPDYPEIVIQSINMTKMLNFVFNNELEGLVSYLKGEVETLQKTGVDFAILASNTPHLVFDELNAEVDIEMLSIVEETCKIISSQGLKKVGLLGTKSTMSKGFYQAIGKRYGIEITIPNEEHQDFVHEKYMGELVFNNIIPKTKKAFLQIVDQMDQIEGLILGGTEIPLLLAQSDFEKIKVFDTTQIHVNAIVDKIIS